MSGEPGRQNMGDSAVSNHRDQGPVEFKQEESKLVQKFKESPLVFVGLAGCAVVLGLGAYGFRRRKLNASMYIMQLRVISQGAIIGCFGIGMLYEFIGTVKRMYFSKEENNPPAIAAGQHRSSSDPNKR